MFSWGFVTGVLHSVVLAALVASQGLHTPGRNQYKTPASAAESRPTSAEGIDEGRSSLRCLCAVGGEEPRWEWRQGGRAGWWAAGNRGGFAGGAQQGCSAWFCYGWMLLINRSQKNRKSTFFQAKRAVVSFKKWEGYAIFVDFFFF